MWFLKLYWKELTVLLALVGLGIWIQRAIVHYGDDRVRVAVKPWQDAQTAWKAVRVAQDKTNRDHNAEVRKGYEADLARIDAELGTTRGLLDEARDRSRRVEEAYRRRAVDAAARISAGEAGLADLYGRIEAARGRTTAAADRYDTACQRDAVRFKGLQDQVRPWVVVE